MTTHPQRSLAFVLAASIVGCSSSTTIRSNVPAKVFIDGALVGNAPYELSDTKIVGSTTSVRLEAQGYDPVQYELHRSEEVSVGAIIGGLFLLVPFLWVMGYKAEHQLDLQRHGSLATRGL